MDSTVETLLSLLREGESTRWVADQLAQTFAQGLSMNVGEASTDLQFRSLEPADLTTRDREKREKFETTRPYTDTEKKALLREALQMLFVALPAVQEAGIAELQKLGSTATLIEFIPPNADVRDARETSYSKSLADVRADQENLKARFSEFDKDFVQ